jgi:hypothetical protein
MRTISPSPGQLFGKIELEINKDQDRFRVN